MQTIMSNILYKILNLTSQCVMGRIIVVDIIPIIDINPNDDTIPTITDSKYDNDIQGNIYEKIMKLSINRNTYELKTPDELKKPVKREAFWFD